MAGEMVFFIFFFCLFCFGFWVPCFFQHFYSDLDIIKTISANWNIAAVCWNIFFLWNFFALSFFLPDLGLWNFNFFFAGYVFWVLCSSLVGISDEEPLKSPLWNHLLELVLLISYKLMFVVDEVSRIVLSVMIDTFRALKTLHMF